MNKRTMTMAVIAFLALGLSGLAQDKPVAPGQQARDQVRPMRQMERMNEALGLTPDQEAKLEAHRKAVIEKQKAFAEQMKKAREEMQALRKDGAGPDPAKQEALIDQMFKLRADQAKAMVRNRLDREKIFTPEQLEKMKNRRDLMMGSGMGLREGRLGMAGARGMMMGRGAGRTLRPMGRMMERGRAFLRNRLNRIRDARRGAFGRIWEE